jgi:cell division protease FtsH
VAYEAEKPRFLDLPGPVAGGCVAGPATQERIDEAVRRLVMDTFDRALAILAANRAVLDRCARELLAVETLDEARLRALTGDLQHAT